MIFAYMDVGKEREQDAVSFAYMDVARCGVPIRRPGKEREQDAISFEFTRHFTPKGTEVLSWKYALLFPAFGKSLVNPNPGAIIL